MSGRKFKVGLTWLTVLVVFFGLVIPSFAVADIGSGGGTNYLKSDMEMMSGIPVHGGGHFNWEVSGAAARDLRGAIIVKYDGNGNGQLELSEVKSYILALERYLEAVETGEKLIYQGAKLYKFQLLNDDPEIDVKGLIGTTNASTGKIVIRFYFNARMPSGDEEILLSDTIIADAIYAPEVLNETYSGTYKIEHSEYMVNIADYSDIRIKKGTFYLIRTPFGEIYHYSATFKPGENPGDKILYEPFNWIECPLVLFVVVAVFGYFIATMPGRFRRYDVARIVKLHTLAKALLVVLILLYFFAGFGGIFISGMYLWLLSVVFLFVSLVVSKTVYENAARVTKMPEKPEISKKEAVEEPAGASETRPEVEKIGKDVQCTTCGEIFQLAEYDTMSSALCPACGGIGAEEMGEIEGPPPPPLEEPPPSRPLPPPPPSVKPKAEEKEES